MNSSLDRLRFVALQKRIKAEWEDKTFKAKTVEKRIDRDWDEKRIEPEWEDRRVESEWEDRRASNGNSIQPEPRSQVVRSAVDANHNANLIPNSKSFKKERKIKVWKFLRLSHSSHFYEVTICSRAKVVEQFYVKQNKKNYKKKIIT